MTAHTSWRRRSASVLATATAVLLAASGALMAPAAAFAEEAPAGPTITVTPNVDLDRSGATVTVSGSGYDPNKPIYVTTCADIALEQLDFTYINKGCTSGAKQIKLGAESTPGTDAFQTDGTFSTTLQVAPKAGAESTAVFTIANHLAMQDRSQDAKAVLNFAAEAAVPSAVSTVAAATTAGLTVATDLANIPGPNGAYVAVIEAGTSGNISRDNMGVASAWVRPADLVDGAAQNSLEVPSAGLDRTKNYEVLVWKGHTMPGADTTLSLAPLVVSAAQWDAVFPPVVAPASSVTAQVSATKTGLTLDAEIKNVFNADGAYITVIEAGKIGDVNQQDMGIGAEWVRGSAFSEGAAKVKLTLPKAELDRKKQYEVIVWPSKSFPNSANLLAQTKLNVTKAQWDTVFPTVAPKIPFTDMKSGDKFYKEISWMYTSKLSTGMKQPDGSVIYAPKQNVSREAMAAFLFRQYAKPGYKAPAKSPFTDVKTSDKFYKEIAWMKDAKISTGVKQANGTVKYLPKSSITREAMAAFMYRIDEGSKPATPKVSPFSDMKPGDKFFKEIAWMHSSGLSTGIKQPSGKPTYAPKSNVTREAMAAFLYRAQP
ncbi:S-layer homology domain-containing protein [Leucobacter chromiireducens]|uniref:SLH domain-containing protein n=1 Tax=Leucobacter chromiireducens subsp. solipictus TaxID=398235 RepID=A0ABS1SDU6_9MICO|nr:S-layer homology domain-containing protein [Leucobacter chromiireducens]MBL3678717.1 hypothetical protein [Leucobacter chromiireducens subsp. solipictus]